MEFIYDILKVWIKRFCKLIIVLLILVAIGLFGWFKYQGVSYEQYNQVVIGMSYGQVKYLMGRDGVVISESGGANNLTTAHLTAEDVAFQELLKGMSEQEIIKKAETDEEFAMNLVKATFRKTKEIDPNIKVIMWKGQGFDKGSCVITFENDIVSVKTQAGLK